VGKGTISGWRREDKKKVGSEREGSREGEDEREGRRNMC